MPGMHAHMASTLGFHLASTLLVQQQRVLSMFNQAVCDLTFESEIKFDCAQMLQATGTHTHTHAGTYAHRHMEILVARTRWARLG